MNEKSDRKELERRQAGAALFTDPVTAERLLKLVKDLEEQLREPE